MKIQRFFKTNNFLTLIHGQALEPEMSWGEFEKYFLEKEVFGFMFEHIDNYVVDSWHIYSLKEYYNCKYTSILLYYPWKNIYLSITTYPIKCLCLITSDMSFLTLL